MQRLGLSRRDRRLENETKTNKSAESGGGLAFASIAAILLGADALSAGDVRTALGFSSWMLAMYGLLGVAVGRMRLIGWSRRSNWWPAPLLRVAG